MRDTLRHFVSEFIGTFALVFIGGGSIMMAAESGGGLLPIAVAHGLILALMVTALMRISAHFNPAVTIAFLVTRRIQPAMAGVYIIAQFLGGVVAAYLLDGLYPDALTEGTRLGGQMVALGTSSGQAFALEMIGTFFLMWVIFGTAVDPQAPKVGGFAIGLTVAAVILAIGPITGGGLNPARTLGPAVVAQRFEGLVTVYFAGPIVGAILAALIYHHLFLPRAGEPSDHGAVQPVHTPVPKQR